MQREYPRNAGGDPGRARSRSAVRRTSPPCRTSTVEPCRRGSASASGAAAYRSVLMVPMLREARRSRRHRRHPHARSRLHRQPDRAAEDLRRPGGDRHRERPAVQELQAAHRGAGRSVDELQRARRGRPGGQLDARSRSGARGHRRRTPAELPDTGGGVDLRVRRAHARSFTLRATNVLDAEIVGDPARAADPAGRGGARRTAALEPGAGADPRHQRDGRLRGTAARRCSRGRGSGAAGRAAAARGPAARRADR